MENLIIRRPIDSDYDIFFEMHKLNFPTDLSSLLGKAYMRKMFEFFNQESRCLFNVLEVDKNPLGYYIAYPKDVKPNIDKAIKRLKYQYIVLNPFALLKYFQKRNTLNNLQDVLIEPDEKERLDKEGFYIYLLEKNPKMEIRGAGAFLMEHFHQEAFKRGYEYLEGSISTWNHIAFKVWSRLGWKIVLQHEAGFIIRKYND